MTQPEERPITLRLDKDIAEVVRRLAHESGRDMAEQIVWLVIETLDREGHLSPDLREWLRLREHLVQQFGLRAVEITRTEGWRNDIISETANRLMQQEDRSWADDYKRWTAVHAKSRINPLLGRRVKLLLRANTGKPFSVRQPHIFNTSSHLHPPAMQSSNIA